ncbi:MAG: thioredoxin family protein [Bacteroidales bacterium]|nr:thioredoxin family protein [Bacteroidales bacterium]
MRKTLFALLLACFAGLLSHAAPERVVWNVITEKTSDTEGSIVWTATIDEGWHIYGMEMPKGLDIPLTLTSFTVSASAGTELIGDIVPDRASSVHLDPIMNAEIPWWEGTISFRQAFKLVDGAKGARFTGTYSYMACNATACTKPETEDFDVTFGDTAHLRPVFDTEEKESASIETSPTVGTPAEADNEWWAPVDLSINSSSAAVTQSSWWAILIMGFIGGLLALLTPCVWPMIPMTVSFFLKTSKERSKSIRNAIIYGLSIIVIFLVLGIVISVIFGASALNELATSAVFNIIFFLLLVIFAISFFGAFDIKLPSKWSNKIDEKAETTSGVLSIFFMAFTLVLVSFSCTGPIIGTLLVEAASQGSIAGPALGMGGFAFGLALPFALFAIFPSFLQGMPKSGGWLNSVKVVLGFIELILSLKFLSVADLAYGWRILDREVFVSLWIVLFVLLGMYLLGKLRFPHDDVNPKTSVLGFFLATISFAFAVYLLPGLWGAPLKTISAFAPPIATQDFNLYHEEIPVFEDYEEGMTYAKKEGKPVMLDFTGYGCVNCRKMEMAVFDTPDVKAKIENDYVLIRLYVDEKADLAKPYTVEENGRTRKIKTVGDRWSYLQRYKFGTNQQPYYVLVDNNGQPLNGSREYDENVAEFLNWLNAGTEAYNK